MTDACVTAGITTAANLHDASGVGTFEKMYQPMCDVLGLAAAAVTARASTSSQLRQQRSLASRARVLRVPAVAAMTTLRSARTHMVGRMGTPSRQRRSCQTTACDARSRSCRSARCCSRRCRGPRLRTRVSSQSAEAIFIDRENISTNSVRTDHR